MNMHDSSGKADPHDHRNGEHWKHGRWQHGDWPAEWQARRRFFMRRISCLLLLGAASLAFLVVGLVALALRYRSEPIGGFEAMAVFCGLPALVVMIIFFAIGQSFRRFATPLADLMAAADAVAGGDLSVRVPERGRGYMSRFVARFNRMTAELERAEQVRRNLTADVAHELRTPLHILQGNLEGVLDGVYEPTREHTKAMLDETRLMAQLVDDLQTLSLAEAGQLPLHPQTLPVSDLLDDVATRFAPAATDQGVVLKVHPDEDVPDLTVDPVRMDQVLSNLVANALRHTPAGGRVTLSARDVSGGVELLVADTGSGIDPADMPFIFDRFWRGDRSREHGSGHAGLGLAIARRLVEAHGGTIMVTSEPGEGSEFVIRLPHSHPV
jgi:two-component system OmpR family sensor kinase/two-component system sensor histidine kinase BaeS